MSGETIYCGGGPVVAFKHSGCGKPLEAGEVYRCLDCTIPLHRDCLREHCQHDLEEAHRRLARVALLAEQLERGGTLAPESMTVWTHPQAYLDGWSDAEDAVAAGIRAALEP